MTVSVRYEIKGFLKWSSSKEWPYFQDTALENKGVSLDVVYELSRVLDLQKIAKELSVRTDPWSNMGSNNTHKASIMVMA